MKALFVFLLTLCTFMVSAQSDRPAVSKVINLDSIQKAPKTEAQLIEGATKTLTVAVYKGTRYLVYLSKTNKSFIIVQSPTSKNWYRKYIKID